MTDLFNKCVAVVLKNEGGTSNDPDDSGGLTRFGISKKYHPDVDVENLTIEGAKEIYFNEYWQKLKVEGLKDENIALQIFDFAVNAGVSRAVRAAQQLTCVLVDGIMGPETIAQINNMGHCFIDRYMFARKEYYRYLVKIKPANLRFLQGWVNRVEHTKLENLTA